MILLLFISTFINTFSYNSNEDIVRVKIKYNIRQEDISYVHMDYNDINNFYIIGDEL